MTIAVETWLSAGYGWVLLLVGYGIDALARRATAVVEGRGRGGFTYHDDHDAWLCPQDQWLWPQSFDPDNRVMRYRGTPSVCNSCPVKDTCTTSKDGREVVRAVDTWPASETARFYRGIACTVAVLGMIWPIAMAFAAPTVTDAVVLLGATAALALASWPLWSHLRRSPSSFPDGVRIKSLDESLEDRRLVVHTIERRRARYGSDDRRTPDAS